MDSRSAARSVFAALSSRASEVGDEGLEDRDYLARYSDEDGHIAPEMVSRYGVNRVLYALDVMGGEGDKPAFIHLVTGAVEILIGERFDGGD